MRKTTKKGNGKKAGAVATRKGTEVAIPVDLNKALLADHGAGFEEAGRDAFAIPFLLPLQDLSPQVKKKMSGYVEGAKPGMIFNTVSQQLFDGEAGIWVIPCHWSQVFIEWIPRSEGGGFVASYPPNHPKVAEGIRQKGAGLILPNGHELLDTRQHFVLLVDTETGRAEGCLLPFKSTGLKVSRRWMSQMRSAFIEVNGKQVEPPMFAWMYRLTTIEEANEQGSWYQFDVAERSRVTSVDLYMQAKAFGNAMRSGVGKVDYETLHSGAAPDQDRAPKDLDDDELDD